MCTIVEVNLAELALPVQGTNEGSMVNNFDCACLLLVRIRVAQILGVDSRRAHLATSNERFTDASGASAAGSSHLMVSKFSEKWSPAFSAVDSANGGVPVDQAICFMAILLGAAVYKWHQENQHYSG